MIKRSLLRKCVLDPFVPPFQSKAAPFKAGFLGTCRGGNKFLIPGKIFFFQRGTPLGGGGLQKKWVLQKKPMSHAPHIITVFPRISCLQHSLAFLCLAIRGTSPCPQCHLRHVAVGGPFSMACFAAQWHELANNVHCRHGWYLCSRTQRRRSTPGYASCRSAPPIARHGRSVGAASLLWTPRCQSSQPAVPVSLPPYMSITLQC